MFNFEHSDEEMSAINAIETGALYSLQETHSRFAQSVNGCPIWGRAYSGSETSRASVVLRLQSRTGVEVALPARHRTRTETPGRAQLGRSIRSYVFVASME